MWARALILSCAAFVVFCFGYAVYLACFLFLALGFLSVLVCGGLGLGGLREGYVFFTGILGLPEWGSVFCHGILVACALFLACFSRILVIGVRVDQHRGPVNSLLSRAFSRGRLCLRWCDSQVCGRGVTVVCASRRLGGLGGTRFWWCGMGCLSFWLLWSAEAKEDGESLLCIMSPGARGATCLWPGTFFVRASCGSV